MEKKNWINFRCCCCCDDFSASSCLGVAITSSPHLTTNFRSWAGRWRGNSLTMSEKISWNITDFMVTMRRELFCYFRWLFFRSTMWRFVDLSPSNGMFHECFGFSLHRVTQSLISIFSIYIPKISESSTTEKKHTTHNLLGEIIWKNIWKFPIETEKTRQISAPKRPNDDTTELSCELLWDTHKNHFISKIKYKIYSSQILCRRKRFSFFLKFEISTNCVI